MKTQFRFKFRAVERLREVQETQALVVLGEAYRLLEEEKDKLALLEKNLGRSFERREELGAHGQGAANSTLFLLEENYIVGLKQSIARAKQMILRAEKRVEKALANYRLAYRNKKIMAQLKERDLTEFKKALAKKEQKQMDEVAQMRSFQDLNSERDSDPEVSL